VDWDAVFTHELAHLRRRDHRGLLVSNLLVIVLPWQPLAWWCRRQIARLADLACDDWVLAAGHARADYAGALLAFVPARGRAWAQAAVSNGGTLRERIRRILESGRAAPLVGRGWSWAAAALAVLVALALACAQPARAQASATPTVLPVTQPHSVSGSVVDSSGQAVAGAEVRAAIIQQGGDYRVERTARTDVNGRFCFETLGPARFWSFSVDDPHYARQWLGEARRDLEDVPVEAVTLTLDAPRHLSGIVRNEDGEAVSGVSVTLTREYLTDPKQPVQGHLDQDLAVTTTDGDGRFRLERLRPGWVTLMLDHPDYARTFSPGDPRVMSGQDEVALIIQRGLTLHGRVTAYGEAVAGVRIQTVTSSLSSRPIGEWQVQTDADGRFELRGISTVLSRAKGSNIYPLVTLSVDDSRWLSPRYQVFDEGQSELPAVEIQTTPRSAVDEPSNAPTIAVNRAWSTGGGTATLSVSLGVPARLANGNPREVWLTGPAGSDDLRRVPVDDRGNVAFDRLVAGEYSVWTPPVEPPAVPQFALTIGDGEERQVTLGPGPARVHGTITCGGQPVTHGAIDVNVWEPTASAGFLQGCGTVNPDGTWEASGLPFGRYRITYDTAGSGHSVPNYFVVNATEPDTRLDLVLPQTRIDVILHGREYKPADFDRLAAEFRDHNYFTYAYPGGCAPKGGNTGGIISVGDGQPFVEHLPPGRWTLFTGAGRDGQEGRLVARVVLDSDTSHISAELKPSNGGTGTIQGALLGVDPVRLSGGGQAVQLYAFPREAAGLDVSTWYGDAHTNGATFILTGLPAGHYGVLIGPADSIEYMSGKVETPLPYCFVPDVAVADGQSVVHDVVVPPLRNVLLEFKDDQGNKLMATWRIDLGSGDWLPYHLFVGSEPRGIIAIPSAFPLAAGEYRLEVTFRGEAPQVRTITVEAGSGVQTIEIWHD
jgi:hypothetical protein